MLLLEWDYWYEQMAAIQAEERYAAYTVALIADPATVIDREPILDAWRALMERRFTAPTPQPENSTSEYAPGMVRQHARRVAGWVRSHFAGVAESTS